MFFCYADEEVSWVKYFYVWYLLVYNSLKGDKLLLVYDYSFVVTVFIDH